MNTSDVACFVFSGYSVTLIPNALPSFDAGDIQNDPQAWQAWDRHLRESTGGAFRAATLEERKQAIGQ